MPHETRTDRARDLRQRQTFAEKKVWQAVRAGLSFRRQHPIDRYFADFACESLKLVIELDGRIHDDDDQQLHDYHRQREIEALGWCVLRFTNDQVTRALPTVLDAIRNHARLAGASIPAEAEPFKQRRVPRARLPDFMR